MSYFKNTLLFGDENFSSGDHFTKGSRPKPTSEKLELGALTCICTCMYGIITQYVKQRKIKINLVYTIVNFKQIRKPQHFMCTAAEQ